MRSTMDSVFDVKWAALYEGEYTADTLPEYQPKWYGAELAECQRYYLPISDDPVGFGTSASAGNGADIGIPVPTTMRITPTLAYDASNFYIRINGSDYPATAGAIELKGKNMVYVRFNSDSVPAKEAVVVWKASKGLALSADL